LKQTSNTQIPMGSPLHYKSGQLLVDMKRDRGRKPNIFRCLSTDEQTDQRVSDNASSSVMGTLSKSSTIRKYAIPKAIEVSQA